MLALIGFPGFAGFFSKDLILAVAYTANPLFFWVGAFTAFLTAFYMTRLVVVAFLGQARTEAAEHPHESGLVMTIPLIILAVLSVIGGFTSGSRAYYHGWSVGQLRATGLLPAGDEQVQVPELSFLLGNLVPLLMVFGGIGLAFVLYRGRDPDPLNIRVLRHKFYFDEFYDTSSSAASSSSPASSAGSTTGCSRA